MILTEIYLSRYSPVVGFYEITTLVVFKLDKNKTINNNCKLLKQQNVLFLQKNGKRLRINPFSAGKKKVVALQ